MALIDYREPATQGALPANADATFPLREPLNEYLASPYLIIDEHLTLTGKVTASRKVWVNGLIKGDLIANSEVWVNGVIEGTVHCPSIVVGESARITGCIMADDAVVNGHVHGDINGLRVRLEADAHVVGDIHHQRLVLEDGAYFKGRVFPM